MALVFVLPRLMFPFMLVAPLFALAFAFEVPPVLALAFVMFEFDVLALAFVVFAFDMLAFAFDVFAFAFMFPLALLVFSAGEHAVHTLATARRVRSAKVLRIECPPVPLAGVSLLGSSGGPPARGSLGALPP